MVSFEIGCLVNIVQAASDLITSGGSREIARSRSSSDYTTFTDLKVEAFIKEQLVKLSPKSLIVAEESFESSGTGQWNHSAFVLDPVDGTINFRHTYNASAISLAYFEQGDCRYSVILDPFRKELFTAVRGEGAFLNGSAISVSSVSDLEEALIGFGTTPYDKPRGLRMLSIAARVYSKCQDIRRQGAAALDLAYVACGRLDGFFEMDLKPWDFYGGKLLIEEAGGTVSDWNGSGIKGLDKQSILATNGMLHSQILDEIRS